MTQDTRHGTDWFVCRDDLGTDGQDADRISRLAHHMRRSTIQTPSLAHRQLHDVDRDLGLDQPFAPLDRNRLPGIVRTLRRFVEPDRSIERSR